MTSDGAGERCLHRAAATPARQKRDIKTPARQEGNIKTEVSADEHAVSPLEQLE